MNPLGEVAYESITSANTLSDQILDREVIIGGGDWERAKEAYYREGLTEATHKVEIPLKPKTKYLWSIRTRKGDAVSAWSTGKIGLTTKHSGWFFGFKTPKK